MNWVLLQNSLLVSVLTSVLSVTLGLVAALWITGLPSRWQHVFLAAAVATLMLPPFLVVNCWLQLLGITGRWRRWLLLDIYSLGGAVWILTLLTWPIALLLVRGAWRRLERGHLETDPLLGDWPMLTRLLIPLGRPALVQSALLTFVLALNNFAVPTILQTKVFPAELWVRFNTTFDYVEALWLSWPLLAAPLLLLAWLRRRIIAWPVVEGPVPPRLFRQRLGTGWFWLSGISTAILFLLATGMPLAELLGASETWAELPKALAAGGQALWHSFAFAASAATVCVALGLATWRRPWGAILWLPFFLPGVLLGMALIFVLNRPPFSAIYQSAAIVVLGLTLRYVAVAWHGVAYPLRSTDRDLTDAARLEGASVWQLLWHIQWPQIAAPLAAAWYVTYLLCLWDVETLVLIIPPGGETAALRIFNLLHYGHTAQVNALCLLLLVLALLPWMLWQTGRGVARMLQSVRVPMRRTDVAGVSPDGRRKKVTRWLRRSAVLSISVTHFREQCLAAKRLRACLKTPRKRRVSARGLHDTAESDRRCRPGALTGRISKQALSKPGGAEPQSKERGQLCPREGGDGEETRGQGCPRSRRILAAREDSDLLQGKNRKEVLGGLSIGTAMVEMVRKLPANLRQGRSAAFRLQARWNFAAPRPLASPAGIAASCSLKAAFLSDAALPRGHLCAFLRLSRLLCLRLRLSRIGSLRLSRSWPLAAASVRCKKSGLAGTLAVGLGLALVGCVPPASHEAKLESAFFSRAQVIGSRGAGAGQFNKPRSVAVDGADNLYVTDMTGRVQKFSSNGVFLCSWQMPLTDLGKAKGMCRDRQGNIVVIEPHYSRVNHFSPEGTLQAQWGTEGTNTGQLKFPRAAAANSRGDVYVSEYGAVERVQRFTDLGAQFLGAFGARGNGPGEFNRAEGLGTDAQDRVYVADSCNHRIQVFSAEGRFLRAYGTAGAGMGQLSYPYDVRVDAQGNQFVCDYGNSRIQVFDAKDRPVEIVGGPGAAPGQFNNPWAVALDSAGNLYVADSGNHRVQKLWRRP
ncbi:MAG: hypothetical protein HY674_09700 [Chloroflexi bacterium]|nr:hypothetical protein [Chloroflexota bacterium]